MTLYSDFDDAQYDFRIYTQSTNNSHSTSTGVSAVVVLYHWYKNGRIYWG
ncbi:MAG: hypothetical protein WAM14_08725 [Candidatus Nitrosopolaris sp.]